MTHTSLSTLSKSLAFAALIAFCPQALAQEQQPPQDQLALPSSEAPAAVTPTNDAAAATAEVSVAPNNKPDPCPAPDAAANKNPDDLGKVQEEIDRFTLCVQRAQLLERLNESELKNREAGDSALGLRAPGGMTSGMAPGMANAQMAGMPGLAPLPANALAGADVSPLAQVGAAVPSTDAAAQPVKEAPEEPKEWTIKEIFGNGSDMQARLLSPEGDEVKARSGTKLPEGVTVVRISPSGVTVRDGGSTKSLEWTRG